MKLLIIQSMGINAHLTRLITMEFSNKFEKIIETDSFDHALFVLPKKGKVLVFSSWEFHDDDSIHRGKVPVTISDYDKNGDVLATMMKKENPNVTFYTYSHTTPQTPAVDGHVQKGERTSDDVKEIFKIIEQF